MINENKLVDKIEQEIINNRQELNKWRVYWPEQIKYPKTSRADFVSYELFAPQINLMIRSWLHDLIVACIFPYHVQCRPYKNWTELDSLNPWLAKNKIKCYMETRGNFYFKNRYDAMAFKLGWL